MKKFILFLFALVAAFAVNAQSTSPRFGTVPGDDNTGRVITYKYQTVTDAAGADSTTLRPSAGVTIVRVALTDSLYFKSPNVKASYAGDILRVVASGASGNKVKFAGTNFITAGTATLSSSGRAVVSLIFDGAKWVEFARVVQ